jgi:hypothetical protein
MGHNEQNVYSITQYTQKSTPNNTKFQTLAQHYDSGCHVITVKYMTFRAVTTHSRPMIHHKTQLS